MMRRIWNSLGRWVRNIAWGAGTLPLLVCSVSPAHAAPNPESGSLSPGNLSLTYTGGTIAGANSDESTCQEDLTCETFLLTLEAGDYSADRRLRFRIEWLVPANDYDIYVHEGALDGPIRTSHGDGAPTTVEICTMDLEPAVLTEPRLFYVHVVGFSVAPGDPYLATVELVAAPPPRNAIYLPGDARFSQNTTVQAPVASQDAEPSARVDTRGNCYVGGIRGVPAGVDLWRFDLDPTSPTFDPGLQNPVYLGQPDAFLAQDPDDPTAGGADGGGDIDISVSFPTDPEAIPVVTISSLAAANVSSAVSHDRGETFELNPAVAAVPADDRQWNESFGPTRVYLTYRAPIPATGLFMARSDDSGFTYPVQTLISASGSSPGYLDVDHASGRIYVSHQSGSSMFVSSSTDEGVTWRTNIADATTSHGNLFDPVKVDAAGNVYGVWSDTKDIWMVHSSDGGINFSEKVRVNDNAEYRVNLLPWIEAGSDGRVNVIWYGTTRPQNDNEADWVVLFAQSLDATANNPTFRQQVISDHSIHATNISLGGLNPTGSGENRNLADYFQVAIDPQGAAVVAYTDDHNDFNGHVYVTRQLDGTSLYADANGSGMVNPANPPPLPDPDPNEPQVFDFLHDAVSGLLQPIPTDNPFDILWIDYGCYGEASGEEINIVATMKVSGLPAVPPAGTWRVHFTANAPGTVSDRGDQFWMRADADGAGGATSTWGTAERAGDGGFTYTERGLLDPGVVDPETATITMRVSFSTLQPFVTHGPPIDTGTAFHGLRGSAFSDAGVGASDATRGGTFFNCSTVVTDVAPGAALPDRPTLDFGPNPFRDRLGIHYSIPRSGFAELSVLDASGRRVRSIHSGRRAAGRFAAIWDGRTDRFSDAPAGVYFVVLHTPIGVEQRKVTLVR